MLFPVFLAGATASLAVGGYHYAALWPASSFFGRTLIAGDDPSEVALTYDDGPNEPYSSQLLEVLARHQVRATFFMIGRYVKERPEVARAIHKAGHLIGSHTMTHPRLIYCSDKRVREELRQGTAAIEDILGAPVRFFRPPFGGRRPEILAQLQEMGQTPVLWNINGHDWDARSAAEIEQRLERGMVQNQRRHCSSNILLHDGGHRQMGTDRRRTVTATANLLAVAPRGGLRFVTVDSWASAPAPAQEHAGTAVERDVPLGIEQS